MMRDRSVARIDGTLHAEGKTTAVFVRTDEKLGEDKWLEWHW
jgi:hypothetical protein